MVDIEKAENKASVLEEICIRLQKGAPVQNLEKCMLNREMGIVEDFRAGGTARQVSLLAAEADEAMEAGGRKGLCMKKFMGNLVTRNLDYSSLQVGMHLKLGDAILEITQAGKECFDECTLVQSNSFCPLNKACAFGKVIQDGEIAPGIVIEKII